MLILFSISSYCRICFRISLLIIISSYSLSLYSYTGHGFVCPCCIAVNPHLFSCYTSRGFVCPCCTTVASHLFSCYTSRGFVCLCCTTVAPHLFSCYTSRGFVCPCCTTVASHLFSCYTSRGFVCLCCTTVAPHLFSCYTGHGFVCLCCIAVQEYCAATMIHLRNIHLEIRLRNIKENRTLRIRRALFVINYRLLTLKSNEFI